jgi:PAS domain S-box-containing protein
MAPFKHPNFNLTRLRTTRSTAFSRELSSFEVGMAVIGTLLLGGVAAFSAFRVDWAAHWDEVLFFGVLFMASALLSVRVPQGLYLGLSSLLAISLTLTTDVQASVVVVFVIMLGVAGLRVILHPLFGMPRQHTSSMLIENLGQAVLEVSGVLVGGLLFQAVSGPALEMRGSLATLLAFGVFVGGYILMREGLVLARLALGGSQPGTRETYGLVTRLLVRQYVWVLLAPVLVIMYDSRPDLYLLLFVLVLFGIVQVFSINQQYLRLRYRLDDLRRLNQIGQQLSSQLSLDAVIETLRTSLSELLDVSGLYIGLWDRNTNTIYYPVRYERGQRLPPARRPFANGVTEHIIRTGESLVVNDNALSRAKALGLEVNEALPHPRSFIGVPMRVGTEVVGVIGLRHYELANIYTEEDIYLLEALATQTANAIQNARNFERSEKKSGELTSLSAIATSLAATLDLQEVIGSVCRAVIEVADASKAAVFLLGEDGETVGLRGSVGLSEEYIEASRLSSLQLERNRAAREGDVLVVENIYVDDRFKNIRQLAREEGFSAVLDIPLRTPEGTLGNLAAYYETPRQFSPTDVELINTLASQMAVVVANAKLFSDMRQRQSELEALYSLSSELTSTLSIDGVCKTVASTAQTTLEAHEALVMIATENNRDLQVRSRAFEGKAQATTTPEAYHPTVAAVKALFGEAESLVRGRKTADLPDPLRQLMSDFGLHTALLVPIRAHRDIVGLIVVGYEHTTDITPAVERLARSIAVQAGVALQNARLFEYTDVMLAIRLEEVSALEEIVRRMTRRLDMYQIIEHVAHAAANASGADHAEVALLNEAGTAFQTVIHFSDGVTHIEDNVTNWPTDRGIVAEALRTQNPVMVDDVHEYEGYVEIHTGTRSELAAPILLDGKPLGAINLESYRVQAFNAEQIHFISNLAEHAAIAIHNARLFERLQRGRAEFRALRGVAVDLLRQNDLNTTLQTIAKAAMENTQATNIHIYLYEASTDTLTFGTSVKQGGVIDDEFAPPRKDGLTARVARAGDPIIIHNPGQHPLMAEHTESEKWQPIEGIVGLPLKRGDDVIGVFNIAFTAENAMTEDVLRFLELLATQASVAISDAQLGEQTRAQRDQLAAILESIQDGIVVMNNKGRILLTNARLGYLLNVRTDDLREKGYDVLIDRLRAHYPEHEKFTPEAVKTLIEGIRANPYEVSQRKYHLHEPDFRAVEEISLPVTDENDTIFGRVFIVRDVTQQYELEQYRQDMSSMMVHDLRSPLSGVITAMNMAMDEFTIEDEPDLATLKQVNKIAYDTAKRLLSLVERILDVNKLDAGELRLNMDDTNLRTLAEGVQSLLESMAHKDDITIKVEGEPDMPSLVGDASLLERILINLVDNAVRYSEPGGTVTIRLKAQQAGHTVTIIDSGPGIPAEFKERIFDRFYQVKNQKSRRGTKGSGLGLNFAKLAVEAHGGRIWVTDADKGGAAFHFTIPTGLQYTTYDDEEEDDA